MHNAEILAGENAELKIALQRANDLLRSTYQVARREGVDTDWKTFISLIEGDLKEQHRVMKKLGLAPLSGGTPPTPEKAEPEKVDLPTPTIVLHGALQAMVDTLKANGLNVISEDEFFAREGLTADEFNRGVQRAVDVALEDVGLVPRRESNRNDRAPTEGAQDGRSHAKAQTNLPPQAFGTEQDGPAIFLVTPGPAQCFLDEFFREEVEACNCDECKGCAAPEFELKVAIPGAKDLADLIGREAYNFIRGDGAKEAPAFEGEVKGFGDKGKKVVESLKGDVAAPAVKPEGGEKLAPSEQPRARGEGDVKSSINVRGLVIQSLPYDADGLDRLSRVADCCANMEIQNAEDGWIHRANAFAALAAAADRASLLVNRIPA